jgi:mono/diheme cytochrome c family protein
MREQIARGIVFLTLVMILGLSALFAARHNRETAKPGTEPASTPAPAPVVASVSAPMTAPEVVEPLASGTAPSIERGRAVYAEQRCSACHSIAGEGNPRSPLDEVGTHLTADELKMWILGTGGAAESLSVATQRRKQRYRSVSETDMNALVAYLQTLKVAAP